MASFIKITISAFALVAINGCATIAGNSSQPVTVSSVPSESKFIVTNESGKEVHSGTTPSTVTLKSSAGYFDGERYSVKYTKEGYKDNLSIVDSSLSGWYLGNLIFGGPLGILIIDPATGSMWSLPDSTSSSLEKMI